MDDISPECFGVSGVFGVGLPLRLLASGSNNKGRPEGFRIFGLCRGGSSKEGDVVYDSAGASLLSRAISLGSMVDGYISVRSWLEMRLCQDKLFWLYVYGWLSGVVAVGSMSL
jgi:hypothetical protein